MNELQQLEQLLDELLRGIQEVIQSGEILTDEFQGMLAQELEYLTSRIDELRSAQQPEEIPDIEQSPIESSNVNGFRYDPKTQTLFVQFLGKYPNRNGSIYRYAGIPPFIFDIIRLGATTPRTSGRNRWHRWIRGVAPSLGAAVWRLLRAGGYPYQRLR